jgi:hypothetical protein
MNAPRDPCVKMNCNYAGPNHLNLLTTLGFRPLKENPGDSLG